MGASPGWLKRALVLCFFGVKAVVFGTVAKYKKPLFGKSTIVGIDDGSVIMCEFSRLSVAMGSLSVLSLLLTVLAGHLAVLYPYSTNKTHQPVVPRQALFRKTSFAVFFVAAELVSASALSVLFWATITQHANLQYQPVMQPDGTVSCPFTAKTDGIFGGGALLALDATLMWFVCLLMSLEARANYLDLHGEGDDNEDGNNEEHDGDNGSKKKLDLHGEGDDNEDGNNEEHDGDNVNEAHA